MRSTITALAAAALLLALPLAAPAAPASLSVERLRGLAVTALSENRLDEAEALSRRLLQYAPDEPTGLMISAEAALRRGDLDAAQGFAARAHPRLEGPARFRAARIVALAHARSGAYTRSQFWLRRALPDAPSPNARAELRRDYQAVRARNPLSMQFTFGVAPSSNVNGGSDTETLRLPGLPYDFTLSGDARALSGATVSAGVALRYRLRADRSSMTSADLHLSGRTHFLSDAARRQAPEARGSDYAQASASVGLRHAWRQEGWSGPAELSLQLARDAYDDAPLSNRLRLALRRSFAIDGDTDLSLSAETTRVERLDLDDGWWKPGLGVGVTRALGRDRASLSLDWREARTDRPDLGYEGLTLAADYDFGRRFGPADLGVGLTAEWRDYQSSRYVLEEREDRRLTAEARIGMPRAERWGFHPEIRLEAGRNWSNADLYDEEVLSLDLGVVSSF
ncbi:tetratricopeptide repeat protein [Limimaricola pyoseonensis]|uniref:Tetratricopeptide repeat-containing protein n=1 Tax=Limimaricola pyoseonensis TaxID=521013 RepID=A0A1G7D310_9RHOB|nr:tetratricopeptide repeat protein [Limimaricola pyoseonensis]SDE45420.1 hypothetical protein SAMN04488567_1745 [Limimaricola pyoseonensis]